VAALGAVARCGRTPLKPEKCQLSYIAGDSVIDYFFPLKTDK